LFDLAFVRKYDFPAFSVLDNPEPGFVMIGVREEFLPNSRTLAKPAAQDSPATRAGQTLRRQNRFICVEHRLCKFDAALQTDFSFSFQSPPLLDPFREDLTDSI
jgi:hypothetical protein